MNQIEAKKQKIEYFSYIIGLISFIVLGKLIGNNGITYMAVIVECVSLFVLLVNGGNSDLIGKLIRSRRKKNQYKEAAMLHKTYILVQSIAALLLMIVYFFMTDVLAATVFKMPFLSVALKMMTPIIAFRTIQSCMQSYFQGMGAHMPTAVSSVFRQLLFFLFGLLLTGRLVGYGEKVSALLNNADYAGMYGAVGICLAILIAEILVTLFLAIIYVGSDRKLEKQKSEEGLQRMESLSERIRLVLMVSLSENMKSLLGKLPFAIGLILILWNGQDISAAAQAFGAYYGYFVCIGGVLFFFVMMRTANLIRELTDKVKKKDGRNMREVICSGLHYCLTIGLFISVNMAVMAPQLVKVIHKSYMSLETYYVQGSAVFAVLIMCSFLWCVLYTVGLQKAAYFLLAVLNIVFVLSYILISSREIDMIAVLSYSALISLGVIMLIALALVARKLSLQLEIIRCFLIPLVGAGAMGLVVMLIQKLLSPHVGSLMCVLLCLAFGMIVYMAVLVATGSIKESEVNHVYGPLGRRIFGIFVR